KISERVTAANASQAAAFVSLHVNFHPASPVRGARVFVPRPFAGTATAGEPLHWASVSGSRAEEARVLATGLAAALSQGEAAKASVQSLNLAIFKGLTL